MRKGFLAAIGAAGLVSIFAVFNVAPVNAQTNSNTGSGLRISPVRSELVINPGETKTVDVYVTNVTDAPAKLKGILNDFGAGDDESGQPRIYLDENKSAPSHGLKKYIKPIDEMQLASKEQRLVKVSISIPNDAAGGGYFGAVRFTPADSNNNENVSLSGSVGTLLLVTVPGDIVEKADIKSFNVARMNEEKLGKASTFFTNGAKDSKGKGIQAVLRVENTGNVQVAPFGKAILKRSGKEIASYELNNVTPKGNVLPDSIRRFTIDLGDKTGSFGKYTLEGNFGYGSTGQLISASTSFYVVPLAYLLVIIGLVLILIAAILIAPRWLKAHDRKLLRKLRSKR
jgi:hypothetical protein